MVGEMKDVKDEMVLLRRMMAQGVGANPHPSPILPTVRVEVPKSNAYKGARSAREIDNFLWGLEQYFRALRVEEDARKVDHAPLYLVDSAMVWWRRRLADMEKCTSSIKTWDEFKKELKRQFYPENATDEARAKLRRLTKRHNLGLCVGVLESVVGDPGLPGPRGPLFLQGRVANLGEARECPKNAALTALAGEREEASSRPEGSSMGSL
ncbi:hypothetical protein GH714_008807 [Hevea brasiliensis]|uniref:Retrotransposon gag domain-containing protein n=1 Tax=Hevea brasiliensis TaxID=3981 RepID=A0A6A6LY27_HEVBR|nr:hypothetical protein GH714_008807 [Hevea brasiliensis]